MDAKTSAGGCQPPPQFDSPPRFDSVTRVTCLLIVMLVAALLTFDYFGIDRRTLTLSRVGFAAAADGELDAIQTAIERGDEATAVRLAGAPGLDVNAIDNQGHSPLTRAAGAGMLDCCRVLLQRGAHASHLRDDRMPPALFSAVLSNSPAAGAIIDLLIGYGADVNVRARSGMTPLMLAADLGRVELVRELIAAGADVNAAQKNGSTALHLAATSDQPAVATLLLDAGANSAARDNAGDTALAVARADGTDAAARAIEEHARRAQSR
jgi:ankyrin repeat protein